eukprot:2928765-Rhodomonas_salina.2
MATASEFSVLPQFLIVSSPERRQEIVVDQPRATRRAIAKPSIRELKVKRKSKSEWSMSHDTSKKRNKAIPAAIRAGDDWDERRSSGITIRQCGDRSAWAAYVSWHASLRAELPEPKRTQFPAHQWITGSKFSCFEEAYQGRKAYLEEHLGVVCTQQVLRCALSSKPEDKT